MKDPFDLLSEKELDLLEEAAPPEWVEPMLATLVDRPFDRDGWIYERKLDGVRLLAFRVGREARLVSRNRVDRSVTYPEIRDALAQLGELDFVADGELVAFEGENTSFSRLQGRMQIGDEKTARERARDIPVYFYAFDLPYLAGRRLERLPLRSRKRLLKAAFDFDDPIRYTPHRTEGVAFWKEACERGREGVMAKDGGSVYEHRRSDRWLKFKCVNQQEFVIGGFTEPGGKRVGFGALLLGVYEGDRLRYAGKVGTGFDDETLRRLRARLERDERKTSPFEDAGIAVEGVHWVTPSRVCEVGFTEWTDAGKLRHPRFVGLRDDKAPEDVVRERPSSTRPSEASGR